MSRFQKRYTILIACTGKAPITLSFQPLVVLTAIAVAVAIPSISVFRVVNSYAQENSHLTERNDALTQEASDILERVEGLEAEIDTLQERAGMEEATNSSAVRPEGGIGTPVDAEILLAVAKAKLPRLQSDLRGEVQPALEQTLDREEARPVGIPLKGQAEISSEFGVRRNPFGRRSYEFHSGLDFKGAIGTPIHVTAPGVVIKAEWNGGYGYHVVVDHGYGYQTLYAHLSRMAVTQGTLLERDRVVGFLGNTGRSSGPHLHYGVYRNGHAVDPKAYLN
ncbi:peptidoglycan DD-metalloendopeptidase family protein [Oscillatoria sp. FACHB-1407]|uniref:M23 family metallopeptidase n=1 Tax=Oscillatoria sp. FACHB-1407 TaxID=2692847 RepID=UPI00168332C7|nr:M23 family metallopeptidase [Oscillatoria sp. FACHB-1407]MBD2461962.1 peptidoglycan DD-metalloendopeptidase family protein [Oscillatoria sp. FACHB-1407]